MFLLLQLPSTLFPILKRSISKWIFHFVRERVLHKDLAVKFVSIIDQLADIFTKSLPTHRFLDFHRNFMATVRPPELEEGC